MLGGGSAVNQDIVEIDDEEFARKRTEHFIHQSHERTRSIGESERHHEPLVEALDGLESSLPLVARANPYMVVTVAEVEFGEYRRTG